MSDDQRSKRMVAAINCVLNHNARDQGAAVYAGINREVVDVLNKHGVGVIQMPCPEMTCLGLPRTREAGLSILDVLDTPEGRACCARLSASVADTIEEYRRYGYAVVALLGGDVASPGCAVPPPEARKDGYVEGSGYGVFIQALLEELHRRDIHIPLRGVRDSARETLIEDLDWLDSILDER